MQEGKSTEAAGQALDLLGIMFPFLSTLGKEAPAADSYLKLDALSATADRQRVGQSPASAGQACRFMPSCSPSLPQRPCQLF